MSNAADDETIGNILLALSVNEAITGTGLQNEPRETAWSRGVVQRQRKKRGVKKTHHPPVLIVLSVVILGVSLSLGIYLGMGGLAGVLIVAIGSIVAFICMNLLQMDYRERYVEEHGRYPKPSWFFAIMEWMERHYLGGG